MPSTSKKQHNFMEAVAHNPAFAKKAGVPQSVGQEFSKADKGRKFSKGGEMKKVKKMSMGGGAMEKNGLTTAKMGAVKAGGKRPHGEHSIQQKGHTKAKQVVMSGGKGMKKGGKVC